jgi:beta-aspartyl-peptidase (threonine type)
VNPYKRLAVVAGMLVLLPACASVQKSAAMNREPIRTLLAGQVAAWNRGDIDGFMRAYWNSEDLTFSSGGKTKRGFAATLAGYRERYPTPERMGHLDFSGLEIRLLGGQAALVLGRWHLQRTPDAVGGNFSLVLQVIDGSWRIIHDHTSVAMTQPASAPAAVAEKSKLETACEPVEK